jgi:hypothetical protein
MDLTELDSLLLLHVPRRLEDYEDHIAVALDLGPLVDFDGLLDRQLVQPELPGYGVELLLRRIVEADPGEPTRYTTGFVDLAGGTRRTPVPVHVDSAINDHASIIRPPPEDAKDPPPLQQATLPSASARTHLFFAIVRPPGSV